MNQKESRFQQPLSFRFQYWSTRMVSAVREGWYRLVRVPFDRLVWVIWSRGLGVPLSGLSRRNAFRVLGDATELWIDPQLLERVVSVKEAGFPKRDFVSDRDWDLRDTDITGNERYVMLSDLWANRNDLRLSETFSDYQRRARDGRPVHTIKKSIYLDTDEAILDYLSEQVSLLDSVSDKGVIKGTTEDDIKVAVDRKGRLIKANGGRKRTAAAIIVGAPALPVRVCHIHQQFLQQFLQDSVNREQGLREALADVRSRYGVEV